MRLGDCLWHCCGRWEGVVLGFKRHVTTLIPSHRNSGKVSIITEGTNDTLLTASHILLPHATLSIPTLLTAKVVTHA